MKSSFLLLQILIISLLINTHILQETSDTTPTSPTTSSTGVSATASVFTGTEDSAVYYTITETQIDASTRTTEADGSDIGQCTCNLLYDMCDPYCCCDKDCQESTLKIWKGLSSDKCIATLNSEKYCFNKELIYKINKRRGMKIYEDDYLKSNRQICIEIDASSNLLTAYQKEYTDINSEFVIADAVAAAKRKDYYQQLVRSTSFSTQIFSSDYGTPFSLAGLKFYTPRPGLANRCQDWSTVNYLESMPKTSCVRKANLKTQTDCRDGFLNPSYFLSKYTLTQIQKISGSSVSIITTAPGTSWGTCKCSNFLRGMTVYIISESQISVDLYIDTVESDDSECTAVEIEQWFEIKHVDTFYFEPSGKPGYQLGKPVLGGVQAAEGSAVTADKNWLFTRGKNLDGTCMTSLSTSEFNYFTNDQINFGENMKTFCSMKFTSTNDVENFCKAGTLDTFQFFKNFDINTAIGKFGNAKINAVNDWIKVQKAANYDSILELIANTNLKCSFPTHQILIIFYKSVGYERARQYQITHAYLTFDTTENGFYYDFYQKSSQQVEFQFEVKFINLDIDDLVIKDKQHTKLLPTIPNDILFPFLNSKSMLSINFLLTVILFLQIYIFL